MRFRPVGVIARKEFLDVVRDRRTLLFMVLLPIVVMPVLIVAGANFVKKQVKEKEARVLTVAIDPQQRTLVTALAQTWFRDHVAGVLPIAKEMGGIELNDLDDIERFLDRIEAVRAAQEKGGGASETVLSSWIAAYDRLNDEQKQLLSDLGAIDRMQRLIRFMPIGKVEKSEGRLSSGIEIPEGLPGELGEERVALAVQDKEIHAALYLPVESFEVLEEQSLSVPVHVVYDSSQSLSKECFERIGAFFDAISRYVVDLRLEVARLSPHFIEPIDLERANVATPSRRIQAAIGGFLPYLLFLFCFMGAFYPALDLTAGEKERFTLETLLLGPVSRLEIAAGKFVVVFVAAIIAAVLSTSSMGLTLQMGVLPENLASEFDLNFEPLAIALTASLLLPIAAVFSALLLGVALCARSFKEAQSYSMPLQFLTFIPAMAALLPDLETELHLAWVPLVNVSLLMKELLKGNYMWDFYAITLASTVALAVLVLWVASRLFQRESVLLRS